MINCSNLVIHIAGDTSMGKTTGASLAVSMGSYPAFSDDNAMTLMRTYDGTENALLASFNGNTGLTALIDEASMFQHNDFSKFIYRLSAGTGKDRLTREGNLRKDKGFHRTTIISTGEKSLTNDSNQNSGKEVRLLQFSNYHWTKDAKHAEAVNDYIKNNYGFQICYVANHILGLGKEEILRRFNVCRENFITKSLAKNELTGRLSVRYAALMLSAELANEALEIELNLDYITDLLLNHEAETVGEKDLGEKAYKYLLSQYDQNIRKFSSVGVTTTTNHKTGARQNYTVILDAVSNEVWGIRVELATGHFVPEKLEDCKELICFSRLKFKELLRQGKFEDVDIVIKKLKDKGYLDFEKGKNTRSRKLTTSGTAQDVYAVRVFKKPEDDLGEIPDLPID
jgi:hypothetical protein